MMKMNTQLLSVVGLGVETVKRRPKISFRSGWLSSKGFHPGALVQALPVPNGMDFTLCDENIRSYSDLANTTKEQGGKLIHVTRDTDCRKISNPPPAINITGDCIYDGGLAIGDNLIARYDYGLIQVRKIDIDGDTKVVPMWSVKERNIGEKIPKLGFRGYWLAEYGFSCGTLATVAACPGSVTFQLQDKPYTELVPYARRNRLKVVQIRAADKFHPCPHVGITGSYVSTAGFGMDDVVIVACSPGRLQVEKLDLEGLGFQFQKPLAVL